MTGVNLGDSLRRLVFQRSFKGVSAHIKGPSAGLNEIRRFARGVLRRAPAPFIAVCASPVVGWGVVTAHPSSMLGSIGSGLIPSSVPSSQRSSGPGAIRTTHI
jgi:hypothetical protein